MLTNAELRKRSITGKLNVDEGVLRGFLCELYEIADRELKKRGFGEEVYLNPLRARIERLECPALVYLKGID